MSFTDDDLEQEGATRDCRFLRISGINDVIEWGFTEAIFSSTIKDDFRSD
jgi:hypothetical protein